MNRKIIVTLILVTLFAMTGCGNRNNDLHGLNGRWEREVSAGWDFASNNEHGTMIYLEFDGDSFTEYRHVRFLVDKEITQEDLGSGEVDFWKPRNSGQWITSNEFFSFDLGVDRVGVTFEIAEIVPYENPTGGDSVKLAGQEGLTSVAIADVDLYVVTVREQRNAAFTVLTNGQRMEVVWEDKELGQNGIVAYGFSTTPNTLGIDGYSFVRVE